MKTPSIMLSGVANEVQRYQIGLAVMPPATDTYMPVRHDVALNMIEDSMNQHGYHFGEQSHALWRDGGARYFGMFQLLNGGSNPDFNLMLGVRNSYDKSTSLTLLIGAHVFMCANMSYSAAQVMNRKHTTHIMRDLPALIDEQVAQTSMYAQIQETRFNMYQDHKITDTRADRLMIQMLREGAIQSAKFSKMVSEWYDPSFDHGNKKAWRLFNACTEALKGTPGHDMPKRTMNLQRIIDVEVGFEDARIAA